MNSYLIVTEGTQTEPNYFNGLKRKIHKKVSGNVDIVAPAIDVKGKGLGTCSLIEETLNLIKHARILYQNVWVVFDRDDFEDFDAAVKMARENNIQAAWSNSCFEYWIDLHFEYCVQELTSEDWRRRVDHQFKKSGMNGGVYQKNDENIFEELSEEGRLDNAFANAKRRMGEFNSTKDVPSKFNPGTTVYQLVENLMQYLQ